MAKLIGLKKIDVRGYGVFTDKNLTDEIAKEILKEVPSLSSVIVFDEVKDKAKKSE